jgi:DNA-directed RNA polymerase specialized sigma24 family protein
MLAALRNYAKVRDPGAVRSWLFSIAARKAADSRRAMAREVEPTADFERLAGSDGRVPASDPALWTRVGRLPAKQRQAVALRYAGDLSHREIAAVMGTTEAAARRNVFEGLARLRELVAPARTAGSHERPRSNVSRT